VGEATCSRPKSCTTQKELWPHSADLLVSMLAENVQWVQNVRAAGGRAVLRSGVVRRSNSKRFPPTSAHMPVNKDATLAEFEKIAAAFPIFRLASHR
jgi:hypothetical protein